MKGRRSALLAFSMLFGLLLTWWLRLPPRNDRDWQPDVAKLPWATINSTRVIIHNIRNCFYRSEKDFDVRHYDKIFNLADLTSMDLFVVDWGLPHIAHTMLSFGFADDEYVCFSIEVRKRRDQTYSALGSFFKQYELTYVVADERDLVRLRTDYRKGEEVYLYRIQAEPVLIGKVFTDYLNAVNRLKAEPQWYNALTTNCTIAIWRHIERYYPRAGFDWRILASGHVDEMVYDLGALDRSMPFSELKKRSHINDRSKAAGNTPDYSRIIRQGLPGFGE